MKTKGGGQSKAKMGRAEQHWSRGGGGGGGRSSGSMDIASLLAQMGDTDPLRQLWEMAQPSLLGGSLVSVGRAQDMMGRSAGGHSPVNDAVNQRMARRMVGGGAGSVNKGGSGIAGIQGGDGNPDYNRRSTYAQIAEQNKYRTNDRAQNRLDMELEQTMKMNMLRKLLGLGGGRTSTETSMEDNWLQTAGNYENRPVKRTVTHDNTMDLLRMIL